MHAWTWQGLWRPIVLQMGITHEHGLSEISDNSQSNMLNLVVHRLHGYHGA